MNQLFQIYQRLLDEVKPEYYRDFYREFKMDNRLMGVVGARGVGKTTFLLQYLREQYAETEKGLYISADNIYFSEHTLVETADLFVKLYGGELLCIDEIHKYKNWNQELKNIYDSYPRLKVIFSGSLSIDLIKGKFDLSRRVVFKTMQGFSFREYLEYKTTEKFPKVTLEEMLTTTKLQSLAKTERILGHLHDYFRQGYYPTANVLGTYQAFCETLMNVVEKTIYEDITSLHQLKTENLDVLRKIIYFFATSEPGSMSINKLATSLGKDHATVTEYIQILKESGMLRFLLIDKSGHALIRNAEKVYLNNTNLVYAINTVVGKETPVGTVRELFTLSSLEDAGYKVFFSKIGDLTVDDNVFEIGGSRKSGDQVRGSEQGFIIKDDILYKSLNQIPLFWLGFLR